MEVSEKFPTIQRPYKFINLDISAERFVDFTKPQVEIVNGKA